MVIAFVSQCVISHMDIFEKAKKCLVGASARFSRLHATKKSRLQQIRDRKFFIYQQVQTKFLPVWLFMK